MEELSDEVCGLFLFPIAVDFIETLTFVQNSQLDVAELCSFNMYILAIYDKQDCEVLHNWLFQTKKNYEYVDDIML